MGCNSSNQAGSAAERQPAVKQSQTEEQRRRRKGEAERRHPEVVAAGRRLKRADEADENQDKVVALAEHTPTADAAASKTPVRCRPRPDTSEESIFRR